MSRAHSEADEFGISIPIFVGLDLALALVYAVVATYCGKWLLERADFCVAENVKIVLGSCGGRKISSSQNRRSGGRGNSRSSGKGPRERRGSVSSQSTDSDSGTPRRRAESRQSFGADSVATASSMRTLPPPGAGGEGGLSSPPSPTSQGSPDSQVQFPSAPQSHFHHHGGEGTGHDHHQQQQHQHHPVAGENDLSHPLHSSSTSGLSATDGDDERVPLRARDDSHRAHSLSGSSTQAPVAGGGGGEGSRRSKERRGVANDGAGFNSLGDHSNSSTAILVGASRHPSYATSGAHHSGTAASHTASSLAATNLPRGIGLLDVVARSYDWPQFLDGTFTDHIVAFYWLVITFCTFSSMQLMVIPAIFTGRRFLHDPARGGELPGGSDSDDNRGTPSPFGPAYRHGPAHIVGSNSVVANIVSLTTSAQLFNVATLLLLTWFAATDHTTNRSSRSVALRNYGTPLLLNLCVVTCYILTGLGLGEESQWVDTAIIFCITLGAIAMGLYVPSLLTMSSDKDNRYRARLTAGVLAAAFLLRGILIAPVLQPHIFPESMPMIIGTFILQLLNLATVLVTLLVLRSKSHAAPR